MEQLTDNCFHCFNPSTQSTVKYGVLPWLVEASQLIQLLKYLATVRHNNTRQHLLLQ